jgi:hypothetical protein
MESKVLDVPFDERRIIVVTDRVPNATQRPSGRASAMLRFAANSGLLGVAGFAGAAVVELVENFREGGEDLYPIDMPTARQLKFPPGHPRKKVIYVGHPVDDGWYIPTADFHRFLFEHKVAEAQRLLRSLGATKIRVVHVEGWDREAAAKLGLGLPAQAAGADLQVKAEVGHTRSSSHQVLATMELTPTGPPHRPDHLVWTPHEPLWAEVADARLNSGLREFVIDVRSTDDFGINAGLKSLINKTGLDAGGKFVEHTNTVWRLEGSFAPVNIEN